LPPDVEEFGRVVPFGVVLRYEDAIDDESPAVDAVRDEAVVTRTLDWARSSI
jgi:hypothetical protein